MGTIACWALWIALSVVLAVQAYILLAHELPVPPFVLRAIESHLAAANLAADFSRAQFDPSGRLLLENSRLRTRVFDDPILTARSLYIRKSVWSILAGHPMPDEIRAEGAVLQLPAPLSPSGTPAPLLEDICLTFRLERNLVIVDQLTFRVANLNVFARGTYQLPAQTADSADPAAIIGQVLQIGREFARRLDRLESLEHPTLSLRFEYRPELGNMVDARLTADSVRLPDAQGLSLEQLVASTTLQLDQLRTRPARIVIAFDHLAGRDDVVVEKVRGVLHSDLTFDRQTLPAHARADLAIQRVAAFDEQLDSPILHLDWQSTRPLRATLHTRVHGTAFTLQADADLRQRTAELVFDGRVPPDLVDAVLPKRSPKLAPYFVFTDPFDVHAETTFTSGWQFYNLRSRVRAERLNSHGVPVTLARGRIDVDHEGNFLAYDAIARIGQNYGRGSYFMNFRSWDYRFLLAGQLQPVAISGWFRSDWWTKFWETNFEFTQAPTADVDVRGNWRDATKSLYYGDTDAVGARVLGADFDAAHAIVFVRPNFSHAFDLRVTRAHGAQTASGWFKRSSDPVTHELRRMDFDLRGVLDPDTLRHLGHETAVSLLKPWTFNQLPSIQFSGHTNYVADGKAVPELKFTGSVDGGMTYEKFPLESLEVTGGVSGEEVRLDQIKIGVAGGKGTGKAWFNGTPGARRLGFDYYIENADLVRGIRAMHEFEVARGNISPQSSPNRELLKRASGGKLQFAISAQGDPDNLNSFNGNGNFQLAGAELGEVHLFGLLSQLLSGLSLNFSSLKLDTLRASYKLANGSAHFPDVRISGPTALIEGVGDYHLNERTLDFSAKFRPYEENRNPLTAVLGLVVNPLASIVDLRLTGPIEKPKWSFSLLGGGNRPAANTPAATPTPAPNAPKTTPEPANTPPGK